MSLSVNFPAQRPTLNLNFARARQLDPRITFTRASTATYFDSSGVLQTAIAGQPRFDFNPTTLQSLGLLIEEQRTNLLTYSSEFDNAAWAKVRSSITANTIVAPDGTLTGDKLIASTDANTNHFARQDVSVTSGTVYTQTVYAKAGEYTQIYMGFDTDNSAFASGSVIFTLTGNGTAGTPGGTITSSSITPVGNGWYRCQITATATATATGIFRIQLATGNTNGFTGDGYSGIYIWGAQLEAGAFPTSYIPTVAATATRNADVASMTGTNFSSWYNAGGGTIYAESSRYVAGISNAQCVVCEFGVNASNNDNLIQLGSQFNTTNFQFLVNANNVGQCAIVEAGTTSLSKYVAAYEINNFAYTKNGATVSTDTLGIVPIVNQFNIGSRPAFGNTGFLNGHIRRIAYYPVRLSNDQLQALTR